MRKVLKRITALLLGVLLAVSGVISLEGCLTPAYAAKNQPYVESDDFIGLKDAFADYFKIGVAMPANGSWYHSESARTQSVRKIFNSMTTENEFKPDTNFNANSETLYSAGTSGNAMLKFCDENGIKMRYHVLVWHSQINASIFGKDFKAKSAGKVTNNANGNLDEDSLVDRETLLERLKTYIYGAMKYVYSNGYADTVYAFDVVNEAVDEGKDDGLRRSYWYKIIGPDFLYFAFLYAREAEMTYAKEYAADYGLDPDGDLSSITPKLFYNDYNEWFPARVNIIIDFTTKRVYNEKQSMVKSFAIREGGDGTMLGDGLIDGIGMQGHLSDTQNIDAYISALEKYNEAVGEVQITELDVGCTHHDENRWYYQAKFYFDLFTRLVAARESGVNLSSVTLWGLSDDATWRSGDDPLVLNGDLSKKPAYDAMLLAAQKKDFTLTLADTITDMEDIEIDFEPYKVGSSTTFYTPEKAGLYPRGSGHQPKLDMAAKINHTPDTVVGVSVVCERAEQDATMMLDVSKFSGKNVTFTAYFKTDDKVVRMGLETGETIPLKEIQVKDEWNVMSMNFDIPAGLSSAYIYFETDGASDLYIDDMSLIYTRDGEAPAPVVGDETDGPDAGEEEMPVSDSTSKTGEENSDGGSTVTPDPAVDSSNPQQNSSVSNGESTGNEASGNTGSKTQEKGAKGVSKGAVAIACTAALAAVVVYFLRKRNNDNQK
ncbi:MAG: endo-1,4-beta-xylanase [Lachnospiraceae bacterium]|nr:endo-1,4-beta-xylanase [Lachnospiraceae bacterium]